MENEKIKICMWKNVADKDLEKSAKRIPTITLSPDKPCYACTGYDALCKLYQEAKD